MSTKCTNLVKTISNNSMHVIIFDYRRIKTFSKLIVFKKINQREVINIKIWNGTFLTELNRLFSKILDFQNFKQAKIQGPTQVFGFIYQTETSMIVVDYNKRHFDCTGVIDILLVVFDLIKVYFNERFQVSLYRISIFLTSSEYWFTTLM